MIYKLLKALFFSMVQCIYSIRVTLINSMGKICEPVEDCVVHNQYCSLIKSLLYLYVLFLIFYLRELVISFSSARTSFWYTKLMFLFNFLLNWTLCNQTKYVFLVLVLRVSKSHPHRYFLPSGPGPVVVSFSVNVLY